MSETSVISMSLLVALGIAAVAVVGVVFAFIYWTMSREQDDNG